MSTTENIIAYLTFCSLLLYSTVRLVDPAS